MFYVPIRRIASQIKTIQTLLFFLIFWFATLLLLGAFLQLVENQLKEQERIGITIREQTYTVVFYQPVNGQIHWEVYAPVQEGSYPMLLDYGDDAMWDQAHQEIAQKALLTALSESNLFNA